MLFAFAYARYRNQKNQGLGGLVNADKSNEIWTLDMSKEYERMGVTVDENSLFKKVNNAGGKLCLSYPP